MDKRDLELCYRPDGFRMGDAWQFADDGEVHCFYLQSARPDAFGVPDSGALGHAVSRDMILWRTLEPALRRGPEGSYDELDIWTGCAVRAGDTRYLYYTSRNRNMPNGGAISVALSEDGRRWVKHPENPVLIPSTDYYCFGDARTPLAVHSSPNLDIQDCRDMCVVYDEARRVWWGYFAARRPADECAETSVIGLAVSRDLIHWEQLPPCFCPDKYQCIETPDVFELKGKWYMLCLTGNNYGQRNPVSDPNLLGLITVYAVSDRPEGPYREPDDPVLLGSMEMSGFCAKTVSFGGGRYLYYIQARCENRWPRYTSLALPKRVEADGDGRLSLHWYDALVTLFDGEAVPLNSENALPNSGQWGSVNCWTIYPDRALAHPRTDWAVALFSPSFTNCVIETEIERISARSAGLIFDVEGETIFSPNLIALLDFGENEVWLTQARNFPKYNARRTALPSGRIALKLLLFGDAIEIYLNGALVLHHVAERKGGKVGLFAERGEAVFRNTRVRRIRFEQEIGNPGCRTPGQDEERKL